MNNQKLITQAELMELYELKKVADLASRKRQEIRQRILSGAAVEQGQIVVEVKDRVNQDLTQINLQKVLGPEIAELIISALPQSRRFVMTLKESASGPKPPKIVFDPENADTQIQPGRRIGLPELLEIADIKNRFQTQLDSIDHEFIDPLPPYESSESMQPKRRRTSRQAKKLSKPVAVQSNSPVMDYALIFEMSYNSGSGKYNGGNR